MPRSVSVIIWDRSIYARPDCIQAFHALVHKSDKTSIVLEALSRADNSYNNYCPRGSDGL